MTRRMLTHAGRRALAAFAVASATIWLAAPQATAQSGGASESATGDDAALAQQGMWIWYVSRSNGGSTVSIIQRARRSRVRTVYIKAGDGSSSWAQFTSSLVAKLHGGGLKVCAWQFVYGDHPVAEAKVGAAAVAKGADCLVIDAEGHYEGKYAAADRYIRSLRARIGASFPLSLAAFPYVAYHPSFPYSVFLGPGGATFNQPQMYWKAIGTTVSAVFAHTYLFNRVYERPILPLGQTYLNPGTRQLKSFRRLAHSYGAGAGVSWWSWQETNGREWGALGARVGAVAGLLPAKTHPVLARSRDRVGISRGDLVVWAQQHLIAAGQVNLRATGVYGSGTFGAVQAFQASNGLPADGVIGTRTWQALLAHKPKRIRWAARRPSSGASASRVARARAPLSATLPARGYEIDPGPRP